MPYLAEADYHARFGQEELTQLLSNGTGLTFAAAEADAASIIDSYLVSIPGRSFALPVTPTPPRVTELAADLTRYELYGVAPTEEVQARRDAALEYLELVASGDLLLPGLPVPDPAMDRSGIAVSAEPRVFDSCTLRGFLGD